MKAEAIHQCGVLVALRHAHARKLFSCRNDSRILCRLVRWKVSVKARGVGKVCYRHLNFEVSPPVGFFLRMPLSDTRRCLTYASRALRGFACLNLIIFLPKLIYVANTAVKNLMIPTHTVHDGVIVMESTYIRERTVCMWASQTKWISFFLRMTFRSIISRRCWEGFFESTRKELGVIVISGRIIERKTGNTTYSRRCLDLGGDSAGGEAVGRVSCGRACLYSWTCHGT